MVIFPKLGVRPGEEPLPIPMTRFTVAWYDKGAVQVIASSSPGYDHSVATGVAELFP